MPCSRSPEGGLLLGGAWSWGNLLLRGLGPGGVPGPGQGCLLMGGCGLLLWPSVVAFYYGLLVWWPSD